jgi:hypothetical protein
MLPSPLKKKSEDVVINDITDGHLFGVLDGVGGWKKYSVDPLEFPEALAKQYFIYYRILETYTPTDEVKKIIARALTKVHVKGSW